ncbi:MAG: FkbM family methyltransferase [Pseudomonadota bacterium]
MSISRRLVSMLEWTASYIRHYGPAGVAMFAVHVAKSGLSRKGSLYQVSGRHGEKVSLRAGTRDLHIFRQVMLARDYDIPPEYLRFIEARYQATLERGETPLVIDAGANTGLYSYLISRQFPEARVICIEPDADNLAMARRNCDDRDNVVFMQCALWSSDGEVYFEDPNADTWAYSVGEKKAGEPVQSRTIDSILAEHPGTELFLLKVDIEGAEAQALNPAMGFWKTSPTVLVEPHDFLPGHHQSLKGVLSRPEYATGDIVIRGENLMLFGSAS